MQSDTETELADIQAEAHKCILRSLSEAVCAVDMRRRIICFNRQAQRLTGVEQQHALGAALEEIFPAQTGQLRWLVESVMESGQAIPATRIELATRRRKRIPVMAKAAPIVRQSGKVDGVTVILQDNRRIELLRRELRHAYAFGDIVTKDDRIRQILEVVPTVARSKSAVLIQGATGTGKELLARAIHSASPHREGPFVAINCGALPHTLLESELFGYEKGAFTDAKEDKPGRFALAEGGTLLLDEIGDVPLAMQVKLLRVLEETKYEPLGSTQSRKADVRIVAATNRDLDTMVNAGQFRADLYYRLNVMEFQLPPLADRPCDIPLLLEHFMELLNAEKGRDVRRISPAAMNCLMRYAYPGNVRELRNILEHAYVLCPDDEIRSDCLPARVVGVSNSWEHGRSQPVASRPLRRMPPGEQRRRIIEVLNRYDGHRAKTANALGIDKSTLWRKMKKFDVNW